jgi:hypothetical protein
MGGPLCGVDTLSASIPDVITTRDAHAILALERNLTVADVKRTVAVLGLLATQWAALQVVHGLSVCIVAAPVVVLWVHP